MGPPGSWLGLGHPTRRGAGSPQGGGPQEALEGTTGSTEVVGQNPVPPHTKPPDTRLGCRCSWPRPPVMCRRSPRTSAAPLPLTPRTARRALPLPQDGRLAGLHAPWLAVPSARWERLREAPPASSCCSESKQVLPRLWGPEPRLRNHISQGLTQKIKLRPQHIPHKHSES